MIIIFGILVDPKDLRPSQVDARRATKRHLEWCWDLREKSNRCWAVRGMAQIKVWRTVGRKPDFEALLRPIKM